jgi:phosphatidylglycerophosphate synthase
VIIAALAMPVGLAPAGWLVGVSVGLGAAGLHIVARRRTGQARIAPADWVTLTRAVLSAGIAGLVFGTAHSSAAIVALVMLASAALVLDAVDGRVARRTNTASALGARFDAEVDAFLILLLSVEVAQSYGAWVLAIGVARYAFLAAGWAVRWLAAPLPSRFWGKFVAAVQGIVLTAAASGVLPQFVGMCAVAAALVLLAHSFGHDVVWLYRRGAPAAVKTAVRYATAVAAAAILWVVLVAPDRLDQLTPARFARIPLEGLVLVVVALMTPPRARRLLGVVAGVVFGLLTVVKILDMAFEAQLDRPFNLVSDWGNLALGIGVVRDSVGGRLTDEYLVLAVLALLALVALVTASAVRLSSVSARHPGGAVRGVLVLGLAWILSAAMSLELAPGASIASVSTAQLAVAQVNAAEAAIRDQQRFEATLHSADPYRKIPRADLLAGLRGKDVLLVFVESYGRVAVQGSSFSPAVDTALRGDAASLARAGYSTRSAFLSSPTFGGMSWIAHATLQSGLWINSQQRFDQYLASNRFSLTSAFGAAGWRTVSDNPADKRPWGEGQAFYHFDQMYSRYDVGYRGPAFSWAAMPDQYTLAQFQRLELGDGHAPVMAEIDLVSSHTPWTPLPRMVPWNQLGDGSVFDPMPAQGLSPDRAWQNSSTVRALYGQSIRYSMGALTSWISRLHDNNLVVVLLGDHQPATVVSGYNSTHDVPISIVAHDPTVIDRMAGWQWQHGLVPGPSAPVWPMDAFRNRFLDTFDGRPGTQLRAAPVNQRRSRYVSTTKSGVPAAGRTRNNRKGLGR